MNKRIFLLALAISTVFAQSPKSTLDGIYTEAQAKRGQAAYSDHCMECHGRKLEGEVENRPLSGDEFVNNWVGGNVLTLFDRIRVTMPDDAPGTLSRPQIADILAYILQANGYPAGKEELTTRSEILQGIKFDLPKQQRTGE